MNRTWRIIVPVGLLLGTTVSAAAASRARNRDAKDTPPAEALPGAQVAAPADAADAKAPSAQEAGVRSVAKAELQTRDVTERLKSLRSEIVLEEEWIQLLKARLARMQLEAEISMVHSKLSGAGVRISPKATAMLPKGDAEADLIVKGVSTRPFKEAIVTWRGRTYTVRPGDKIGPVTIKDVTDTGVQFTSGNSAMLGQ